MEGIAFKTLDKVDSMKWSHRCPWKAIAQVFQEFSPFVRLVVGNEERIRFWEDL